MAGSEPLLYDVSAASRQYSDSVASKEVTLLRFQNLGVGEPLLERCVAAVARSARPRSSIGSLTLFLRTFHC